MSTREATDTIKGYCYQFDKAIYEVLNLSSNIDSITVEGIEDIDLNKVDDKTAIQCKYYAKSEYNHSVIAKPIRLMVEHFSQSKRSKKSTINYYLYGHYRSGQEKLETPISVAFLKEKFLRYTKNGISHDLAEDYRLSDKDIEEFVNHLTLNIYALDFETQQTEINELLKDAFKCSDFEAENYFYNNAFNLIVHLSHQDTQKKRTISKQDFLSRINKRKVLFNLWFVRFKGKDKYLMKLRRDFFTSGLNLSPYERFFLIEVPDKTDIPSIKDIIYEIQKKYSKTSRRAAQRFVPYILLYNIQEEQYLLLKNEIFLEGHQFCDGYPFKGSKFNAEIILQVPPDIEFKFVNSIRDLEHILKRAERTREIYQFYVSDDPFYENDVLKHIKIQVEDIEDIKKII